MCAMSMTAEAVAEALAGSDERSSEEDGLDSEQEEPATDSEQDEPATDDDQLWITKPVSLRK